MLCLFPVLFCQLFLLLSSFCQASLWSVMMWFRKSHSSHLSRHLAWLKCAYSLYYMFNFHWLYGLSLLSLQKPSQEVVCANQEASLCLETWCTAGCSTSTSGTSGFPSSPDWSVHRFFIFSSPSSLSLPPLLLPYPVWRLCCRHSRLGNSRLLSETEVTLVACLLVVLQGEEHNTSVLETSVKHTKAC